MSPFTVLVLCIQACLIQSAFGQICGGSRILSLGRTSQPLIVNQANSYQSSSISSAGSCGSSNYGSSYSPISITTPISSAGSCGSSNYGSSYSPISITAPISSSSYSSSSGGYGGQGIGEVGCNGDIYATGNTIVTGAVPVLGSVCFSGTAPASGSVCITGQCGCGCSQ